MLSHQQRTQGHLGNQSSRTGVCVQLQHEQAGKYSRSNASVSGAFLRDMLLRLTDLLAMFIEDNGHSLHSTQEVVTVVLQTANQPRPQATNAILEVHAFGYETSEHTQVVYLHKSVNAGANAGHYARPYFPWT